MSIDIEHLIYERIEEFDIETPFNQAIQNSVKKQVGNLVEKYCKDEITRLVKDEIESVLRGGEITISDGWTTVKYSSFEAMFKKEFKERLDKSWDMKKTIEGAVKDHVHTLFSQHQKNINTYIIEKITGGQK